jgi:cytochrome P450
MSARFPIHRAEWHTGDPFPGYRTLRREDPVHWNEESGFWALLRYEDVRFVSSHPELFTSTKGITIPDPALGSAVQPGSLIFTDPPLHRQLRKLVLGAFTLRQVGAVEPRITAMVDEILATVPLRETFDFAETLASPLPTRIIAQLLGAPEQDWERFREWSDDIIAMSDPESRSESMEGVTGLHAYFTALIADRRADPRDDLISQLTTADLDGEPLSDQALYMLCWLLLVAGNETTRNLIALGMKALLDHPEQHELVRADPDLVPSAVEEMLRWCVPVTHMARTANQDIEIRGQTISEGETVVMLYGSANRDEDVFGDDAELFDVRRHPNPHIAFGYGEHLCLGANLARLEARAMFAALLTQLPPFTQQGEVVRVSATMVPGVKQMPVSLLTA